MNLFQRLSAFLVLLSFAWAVPVTFVYDPPAGLEVRSVSLRGSFNNWGETAMQKQENSTWAVTLDLPAGTLAYKFFINGQWPPDMCADNTYGTPQVDADSEGCVDDGQGGKNAIRQIKAQATEPTEDSGELTLEHDPNKPVFISQIGDKLSIRFKVASEMVKSALLEADQTYPAALQLATPDGDIWRAVVPATVAQYSLKLTDANGAEQSFGPFAVPKTLFKALDWVSGRVGYQVFLDRFWNGDPSNDAKALETSQAVFDKTWSGKLPYVSSWSDPPGYNHCCQQYFGGDLAGLIQKLPHLKSLGVNFIYFNPLFDSGTAHGYDTHNYLQVSPKFGDMTLLKRALNQAHRLGIKVVFDFVPNHTGTGFWAFQDVVKNGPKSSYWDWYIIKQWPFTPGDGRAYETYFGQGYLPKLNSANPKMRDYLYFVAKFWIRFGFDGLRIDHPQGIIAPEEFYPELRRQVRSVKPDAYVIGEIGGVDQLQGNMFDSVMNYFVGVGNAENFTGAVAFAKGGATGNPKRILGDLGRVFGSYPEAAAAMSMNLFDSHDYDRVLTRLGGGKFGDTPSAESLERLKLATAILYALPGLSVIFQGDECGINGEKGQWPINELYRYPVQWDKCNPGVLTAFQQLGKLRLETKAFRSSVFRTYKGEGSVLAFLRGEPGVGEVLAVFNNGEAATLELPDGNWRDTVEGRVYRGKVEVGGLGWRYLEHIP